MPHSGLNIDDAIQSVDRARGTCHMAWRRQTDALGPKTPRGSVASFDATVAIWDAKFHHWTARPNQFDSTLTTTLPTYPIPDYPSGHAATLGGTAQVLELSLLRDEHFFQSRAEENAASRVWAGIHFRSAAGALPCPTGAAGKIESAVIGQDQTDGGGTDSSSQTANIDWQIFQDASTTSCFSYL